MSADTIVQTRTSPLDSPVGSVVEHRPPSPQRPLTDFLSWLIEEPERLERYHTVEGFQELAEERGLPPELQQILRGNDLRSAMEVVKAETGSGMAFIIIVPFSISS